MGRFGVLLAGSEVLRRSVALLALALAVSLIGAASASAQSPKVLVFHGGSNATNDAGVAAITALGTANSFTVDASADATTMTAANLANYRAVVFLNSAGDRLNAAQEGALQAYVQGGGGFVGIGSTAEAETGNTFFNGLIGARPASSSSTATTSQVVAVGDRVHPSTRDLPLEWTRDDVWYTWTTRPTGTVHTLARYRAPGAPAGDGTTTGGTDSPISWCRDFQGGRSFYTGMGRTAAAYGQDNLRKHLLGGIQWAAGLVRGGCKATITSNYTSERIDRAARAPAWRTPASPMASRRPQRLGVLHRPRGLPHGRRARRDDRPGLEPEHPRLRQPQRRRRLRHDPLWDPAQATTAPSTAASPGRHHPGLRRPWVRRRDQRQDRDRPARHRALAGLHHHRSHLPAVLPDVQPGQPGPAGPGRR